MDFQSQNTGTADCCIFRPPSGQILTAAHLVIFCQHGRPCEPKTGFETIERNCVSCGEWEEQCLSMILRSSE